MEQEGRPVDAADATAPTGQGVPGLAVQGAFAADPRKLIANLCSGTLELYHLEEDPGETLNVIERLDEAPAVLRRLLGDQSSPRSRR